MSGGRGVVLAVALAGAVLAARAAPPPEVDMEEGLWRLGVEMEIPGKGPDTGPLTQDICLRPSEVTRLAVPPGSPCQIYDLEITKRRMRWKFSCEQGAMRSKGDGIMEFGGRQLSSAMVVQTAPPYAMRIKQAITGRRLGPCPPGTATGATPLKPYGK